ncbi:MAG: glycoside hydrolase [Lachnospiraceae bacterium]|nr:glycoside hydrolase [Lachnospiraceae bacterium]
MQNKIQIHTNRVKFPTAPELYGLFFEDINHAADGGLYPEMIRNRAFEDSLYPEGCTVDANEKIFVTEYGWPGAFNHGEGIDDWANAVPPTKIPGWYAEGATFTLDEKDTLNRNRKAALQVKFEAGGKIYNIGYAGVPIRENDQYAFYFFVKNGCCAKVRISLESENGEKAGSEEIALAPSKDYTRYSCVITATGTHFKGRVSISCDAACELKIGFTSLMPCKTFKGHGLREDLALALKNTHSKFIRFPGGCVVEGINEQNSLLFSRTIGPVWERPSCFLMWHYRTTNGLGFHEYLQLCEDLDMEAMYVCNCGISCQARHGHGFSKEVTDQYLEEALHALEYALGDETTTYGALRAKMGHKEPFKLKYVEIGNENWGQDYAERYPLFYHALKKAYPDVIYISDGHTEREGLPTEFADEHYYNAPEFFLENGDLFDDYDRNGPKIFLGEYAVNGGNTISSMECALAEASFLLGVENNQDIVRLTAYAPLFQNSDYTAWKPNMIIFDNHRVYGIPSYHAVSLLAKYRGAEVIATDLDMESKPPVYRGIPGIQCDKEGLEFRNPMVNGKPVEISRCIYGTVEQENGCVRMVKGGTPHHYTGKSPEWNEAFESFVGAGRPGEIIPLWVTFGTEDLTDFTFEIDVKVDADNPVTFNMWNFHPETDAGCVEPRDMEWNMRSVRNQSWRIENGIGQTRVPHFFDKPLCDEEKTAISIDYSVFNHYKIVCDAFGFTCYINGEKVQERKHPLHPVLAAVSTQDADKIYLKIVNVDDQEQKVTIETDCAIGDEVCLEVLAADPDEVNSFADMEKVSAKAGVLEKQGDLEYSVPAHSVNVLVLNKRG